MSVGPHGRRPPSPSGIFRAERLLLGRALVRAEAAGIPHAVFALDRFATRRERDLAMAAWLEEDRKRRASRSHHQYSLADAGLTVADVDRMTGDYLKAFNVPLER